MGLGECYPFKSDLVMARLANQALKSYRTQVEGRQRGDLMGTLRKRIVVLAWTIKLRSQRREQKICKDTVILVQFCKEGDDRRYDQRHSPGRSDFSKLGAGLHAFSLERRKWPPSPPLWNRFVDGQHNAASLSQRTQVDCSPFAALNACIHLNRDIVPTFDGRNRQLEPTTYPPSCSAESSCTRHGSVKTRN